MSALDSFSSAPKEWILHGLPIPARSTLYSLEPVGIGTPDVESLTGYISRLAEAHCVTTLTLAKTVFALARGAPQKEYTKFVSNHSEPLLNGLTLTTRAMVDALGRLTLRKDLSFLTMLRWSEVLPPHKLLKQRAAWCPECCEAQKG